MSPKLFLSLRRLTRTFGQLPSRFFAPCPEGIWVQATLAQGPPAVCPGKGQVGVFRFPVRVQSACFRIWSVESPPAPRPHPTKLFARRVKRGLEPQSCASPSVSSPEDRKGCWDLMSPYHSHPTQTGDTERTQTLCMESGANRVGKDLTTINILVPCVTLEWGDQHVWRLEVLILHTPPPESQSIPWSSLAGPKTSVLPLPPSLPPFLFSSWSMADPFQPLCSDPQ